MQILILDLRRSSAELRKCLLLNKRSTCILHSSHRYKDLGINLRSGVGKVLQLEITTKSYDIAVPRSATQCYHPELLIGVVRQYRKRGNTKPACMIRDSPSCPFKEVIRRAADAKKIENYYILPEV